MKSSAVICQTCCSLFLTVALTLPASGQEIPQDETAFSEYVAGQIRTQISDAPVTVQGPLTIKVGGLQANLDRIFAFCRQNTSGCPNEVAMYVKGVAETYRSQAAPISADAIRVVVRTSQYVQQIQNSLGPDAPSLLPTPFVDGLVLLPVVDTPTTFKLLSSRDLKTLGLSEADAQQLALKNLRTVLAPRPLMEVAKVARSGQIGSIVGDSLNPSRLALFDTWAPLAQAQGGKMIVVAPATDAVFYVGEDAPIAVDSLRTLARNVMARAPHALSDILLRWTPTGWEIVR